jgi:hypothetical protein
MPLVKTFAQACKHKGLDPKKVLPNVSGMPKEHRKAVIAAAKLFIIVDVLNDGWVPNWDDRSQEKWWPCFYLNKPGFRIDTVYSDCTRTNVSFRLCFKSKDIALYAAKNFKQLYRDLMVR